MGGSTDERRDARPGTGCGDLLAALRQLDRLLGEAVGAAEKASGDSDSDPFAGLHISPQEVRRLLALGPGAPAFHIAGAGDGPPSDTPVRLAFLQRAFGLSDSELDVLVIALGPEVDLRYERLYAYLQDDLTRRRPTADLALDLLCRSAEQKLAERARFAPDAPLLQCGLLHLVADPNHVAPPLLAQYLKVDDQVVRFLLGQDGLDPRLSLLCRLVAPAAELDEMSLDAGLKQELATLVARACDGHEPLRLYLHGPRGAGKRRAAEALAGSAGMRLLEVKLERARSAQADFGETVRLALREARFRRAVPYLADTDALHGDERASEAVLDALATAGGMVILGGTQPAPPPGYSAAGIVALPCTGPDFARRRARWDAEASTMGMALGAGELDALAGRFNLSSRQIADAAASARNRARWRAPQATGESAIQLPTLDDLFAAARAESGREMTALARKIDARYRWGDIVLPPDQLAQLAEICDQAKYRHVVYGDWGFDRKLSLGKGLNVLFSGPPGTGKTMAAEVIATELGLDLYKIDLSQVVSKYIGETEKNLDRIFAAARSANAILFFDEADALFGKRSEVKDAHDRYANIEVGYLLQKMEEYEGVAILATNLRSNLDEAFVRRMQAIVEFPFPDEEYRRRIWQVVFPREAPLGGDVDFGVLARDVRLAGGSIKNIGLAAAFLAAGDGRTIRMPHLVHAARREHQKLGRTWSEAEPARGAVRS